MRSRTLVEDVGPLMWEGGTKTTPDIKREIIEGLDEVDSLVVLLDVKAAEKPEDPQWWPSLRQVNAWQDEDPFFAKAIDQWKHARQEVLLERVIYDLNSADPPDTKQGMALLKERVKFASAVLPRTVNKGMREKVDVETTSNHLHLHANLSDEALTEKLNQLRRNPRLQAFLSAATAGETIDEDGKLSGGMPTIPPPREIAPMPDISADRLLESSEGGSE